MKKWYTFLLYHLVFSVSCWVGVPIILTNLPPRGNYDKLWLTCFRYIFSQVCVPLIKFVLDGLYIRLGLCIGKWKLLYKPRPKKKRLSQLSSKMNIATIVFFTFMFVYLLLGAVEVESCSDSGACLKDENCCGLKKCKFAGKSWK